MDKTIDHRLAWLAGIIDGEGYVGMGYRNLSPSKVTSQKRRNRSSHYQHAFFLVVVNNTDEAMIAEIRSIAVAIGVSSMVNQCFNRKNPRHKPFWRVSFKSRVAVDAVLRAVFPYLVTKRARAELILGAIAHRRSFGQPRRGENGYTAVAADPAFLDMVDSLHRMNRRGIEPQEA